MLDVALHQQEAYLVDAAAHGHDLRKDFLTLAATVEHPLKALHLPLDAAETRGDRVGIKGGFRERGLLFFVHFIAF
ncbi:MAG: hypothetical protein AB7G38_05905 [Dehalococcoidia bacterium]